MPVLSTRLSRKLQCYVYVLPVVRYNGSAYILGIVLYVQGFGAALGCGRADVDQSRLGQLPLLRWPAQDIGGQGK